MLTDRLGEAPALLVRCGLQTCGLSRKLESTGLYHKTIFTLGAPQNEHPTHIIPKTLNPKP